MTTPIDKLEANLKKAQESKEYKKLVVLISTGAYNPVHKQHVEIFNTVKTALDKEGYNVIAGFLSPSHAEYVSGKLGKSFIPTKHRLAMCALSCADSSWINVDPWEAEQSGFIDFPEVSQRMHAFVTEKYPKADIAVKYVCGTDHVKKCGLAHRGIKNVGVVGLTRPGYTLSSYDKKKLILVDSAAETDVSSTRIRKAVDEGDLTVLSELMAPAVLDYAIEHDILGMKKLAGKRGKPSTVPTVVEPKTAVAEKQQEQKKDGAGAGN